VFILPFFLSLNLNTALFVIGNSEKTASNHKMRSLENKQTKSGNFERFSKVLRDAKFISQVNIIISVARCLINFRTIGFENIFRKMDKSAGLEGRRGGNGVTKYSWSAHNNNNKIKAILSVIV